MVKLHEPQFTFHALPASAVKASPGNCNSRVKCDPFSQSGPALGEKKILIAVDGFFKEMYEISGINATRTL